MLKVYKILENRVVDDESNAGNIRLYVRPDEIERRFLIDQYHVDEHTLNSCLDADELSRLEFEPDHLAMIFKIPRIHQAVEPLLFRVNSIGLFLFKDQLIVIMNDEVPLFSSKVFNRVSSLNDVMIDLIFTTIVHFMEHLKAINMVSDDIEKKISTSMENSHLLNQFTLGKSLVFFQNAINSNGVLLGKIKLNSVKMNLTPEEIDLLDDTIIENNQCYKQAEIYANILTSLMNAKASIISNNLSMLMKTLNLITIMIMVPTFVVSAFSMNVGLPFDMKNSPYSFVFIMSLALVSVATLFGLLKLKKW